MDTTKANGAIEIIKRGDNVVLPVTSSHAVLLNETHPDTIPGNTLAAKLEEIDKSISDIKTVTDNIQDDGDGSIEYTEDGLVHTNTTTIPQGLNPTENEAIYKFKIDNNGHITDIKEASLEDFGVGTPINYYGEYPTNNSSFTPSVGEMYLVNEGFIKKYHKGDINGFAIYNGENFNIIYSDITPNIQLNNGTVHIYGTGGETNIYAPTELGQNGKILGTDGTKLTWMDYPNLNLPLLYAEKINDETFITYNRSKVYLQGDDYISVNQVNSSKIKFSLNSDKLKTSGISFNVSGDNATLSSGGQSVTLTGDNVSFSNDNGNLKLTASKPGAGIGLTYEGNTLKANLKLTQGITSKGNQVTVTTQLGTSDGGEDAAIFGSTAFAITVDDNIKIGNGESAITLSTDGLAKSDELNSLSTSLNTEITNRTSADTNLSNEITRLQGTVESMHASYPYITKEIWGENHNWDWSKSSRIDNLESTVNNLSYIQTINGDSSIQVTPIGKTVNLTFNENKLQELIPRDYEVFGWDLEFGGGLIPMPHENALWITKKTGGYIKLPYPGTYKIKFKGVSPLEISGQTSKITINGVDLDGFYNGTAIYKELITTSNDGKITIGAEYAGSAIFDISITSSRDRDIKQLTKESVFFVTDIQNLWVSSGQNIINEQLNDGFYSFSFKIKGSSPIGLMCWPIIDPSPKEPLIYNGVDQTKNRYFRNNAVKYYNINKSTYTTINSPYYYIPDSSNLLVQTVEPGNYSIKDFTVTKLKFVDNIMGNSIINSSTINTSIINTSTINNSIINNPNLILSSGTSKLFSGTNDAGNVCLKYTLGGILKWTLDENGIQMNTDSNLPVEPIEGTVFYYSLNRPTINTKLSNLEKRLLNVFNININTKNGYYISPINTQLGLDYEVHDCYVINNGSQSTINIYVQNDCIIQDPNLVA